MYSYQKSDTQSDGYVYVADRSFQFTPTSPLHTKTWKTGLHQIDSTTHI